LKRLIVTGDDFGASIAVNAAIEQAHRTGILNTASLMVSGAAAGDAIRRARALPDLKVGLHLVLVRGRATLPTAEIPDLADDKGNLPTALFGAGLRFYFSPRMRRQLAAEIRAQFERFRDTGLTLDHVNAHNHMHLHPTVLDLVLSIGKDYGLRAVRLPHEPFLSSWRAAHDGLLRRLANDLLLRPLIAQHRRRLARGGIARNDYVFGMNDTGAMVRERLLGILAELPEGVSEIYCHPATGPRMETEPLAAGYRFTEELDALTDQAVAGALARMGIERTAFGALASNESG
jgi:hopanoid biosynthesis associated protein HpnK